MLNPDFWRGRRVLITGHTGFKGAWLAAWLTRLGARASGYALAPDLISSPFERIAPSMINEMIGNILDLGTLTAFVREVRPEIVIHMAAQPLVRLSYRTPIETFGVNAMGTANILEAVRDLSGLMAVVVVTTDKVYENLEAGRPFVESDKLGGHDPYSASKACAEILASSYTRSFFSRKGDARIVTARSGNVIGGGDGSLDRIVPDLVRALADGAPVRLRYPRSVRPWLHVLEPLAGYLSLAEILATCPERQIDALNFAPDPTTMHSVAELVERFGEEFGGRPGWLRENGDHPRESELLTLDATRAADELGWRPMLSFDETVQWTAEWYRLQIEGGDVQGLTFDQIDRYAAKLSVVEAEPPRAMMEHVAS